MKYSIVMPCFNEAHVLERSLGSINQARQGRTDVQVILVDNGSTDNSRAIAQAHQLHPADQVLSVPRLCISAVRNAGARASEGRYLLFVDADIQVPANWLTALDTWFDNNRSDVLGFVDLPPDSAPWFARIWGQRILARRHSARTIDFLPGRNISLSRHWFDQVNGFDEKLKTGEDKDFVMRLGKAGARVMTDASLNLVHLGFERDFPEWMRKEYWRQHSHIDLLRQQGISLRLLRFPVLAVGHLGLVLLALLTLLKAPGTALGLLLLSILPSLALTLRCPAHRIRLDLIAQSTFLYWSRFLIAGVSILRAAWEAVRANQGEKT